MEVTTMDRDRGLYSRNRRQLLKDSTLLLGGALSVSVSRALLAGTSGGTLGNVEHSRMVAVLAELIIPETDTPGAIAAGVPAFIEGVVTGWYTATERRIFLQGLAATDHFCRERYRRALVDCSSQQQTQALQHQQQEASSYAPSVSSPSLFAFLEAGDENTPFFHKLRELSILGYYTSEVGARQEHRYNPMPGRYQGEYPLAEVGRQWSS